MARNLETTLDRIATVLDAREAAVALLTDAYGEISTGDHAMGLVMMADSILLLQANLSELRREQRKARLMDAAAGQRRLGGVA